MQLIFIFILYFLSVGLQVDANLPCPCPNNEKCPCASKTVEQALNEGDLVLKAKVLTSKFVTAPRNCTQPPCISSLFGTRVYDMQAIEYFKSCLSYSRFKVQHPARLLQLPPFNRCLSTFRLTVGNVYLLHLGKYERVKHIEQAAYKIGACQGNKLFSSLSVKDQVFLGVRGQCKNLCVL